MLLDETQRRDWERDGFLVIRNAIGRGHCARLRERAASIIEAFDPSTVSIFSTNEQTRTSDEYFLASGGEISCFFEEEAFDEHGALTQAKDRSINKIGHALHDLDPVFDEFSRQPALADIATSIGMGDSLLLQSMYIFKQPHIGGEVSSHQDATFLWSDGPPVVGLWVALEDATIENGCLWAQPGGHHSAIRRRFRRDPGGGTRFDELDATPLPAPGSMDLVPIEAETGTVVLLHGALPHRSEANRSPRSRQAYTVHLLAPDAPYPADNWLQRPDALPLRGFGGSAAVGQAPEDRDNMTPTPAEPQLSFRPMAREDLPLLQHWLEQPHVARWWDDASETIEAVEAKYTERISGDHHVTPWMVEADGVAFGFVQWYRVADEAEWFPDLEIDDATLAIDLAIGEPDHLGRGLGKRMVLEFLHHVLRPASPDSAEVWIDPNPKNERAMRTYAAAGFRDTGIDLPDPDDPAATRRLMRMTWAGPTFR